MAITIHANPKDFAPVYNKMEYLISSTNTSEPNFAYLVDIYINGSVTKTVRLRIPVRPSDSKGKVDIHRVLESALTSNVGSPTGTAGTYEAVNSSLSYVVEFGEEYGTTVVQYPNLTTDSSRKAFNASLEKRPFINWDVTEYEMDGITKKFLTNMPDNNKVSIDSHGWLYFKEETVLSIYTVVTYNSSGTLISSFKIDATATSGDIQFIPSSPASLNNIDNANIILGSQPIIDSTVASYKICLGLVSPLSSSETRTFQIEESCKYNSNTLIFQNNLGAFDSFTFYKGDMSTTDIERKDMKVNVDNVVSNDIVYSMNEREKVTYYTKKSETIKLMSDWITEEESNWLLELISSPEIYLQEGNELTAVAKIKATNYAKKKVVRDKLFKIDVELELGYDDYRQRM
tara:strand:+ start:551 stop:1756 length:1206 start_codon:yes stop_codon:yes gene_type:complete